MWVQRTVTLEPRPRDHDPHDAVREILRRNIGGGEALALLLQPELHDLGQPLERRQRRGLTEEKLHRCDDVRIEPQQRRARDVDAVSRRRRGQFYLGGIRDENHAAQRGLENDFRRVGREQQDRRNFFAGGIGGKSGGGRANRQGGRRCRGDGLRLQNGRGQRRTGEQQRDKGRE